MTYVIHVRGNSQRREHMQRILADTGLTHEFILDGNMEDLTGEILENNFTGPLKQVSSGTSCVYKHLLACRRIVDSSLPYALILEDDIIPLAPYRKIFPRCLAEMKKRSLVNCVISLENSGHSFIRRSERIPGTLLYRKEHGRCAGAYIIDRACAQSILRYVQEHRCSEAMDWLHNRLIEQNILSCYWLEPPVFEQASNSGRIHSLLEAHKKDSAVKRFNHDLRRAFRRLISHLR